MNPITTSELSHGAHPRLGNNVHNRAKHDRKPARLGILQETRGMVLTVGRLACDAPHGSIIHHTTGNFLVDRSSLEVNNSGEVMQQPKPNADDLATVQLFQKEQ